MGRKSRPHWDSIPDRPARSSVAIPSELPGPHIYLVLVEIFQKISRKRADQIFGNFFVISAVPFQQLPLSLV